MCSVNISRIHLCPVHLLFSTIAAAFDVLLIFSRINDCTLRTQVTASVASVNTSFSVHDHRPSVFNVKNPMLAFVVAGKTSDAFVLINERKPFLTHILFLKFLISATLLSSHDTTVFCDFHEKSEDFCVS